MVALIHIPGFLVLPSTKTCFNHPISETVPQILSMIPH